MGLLDDAIREHLDLKRRRGADPAEVERAEREALGPVRRGPEEPASLEDRDTLYAPSGDAGWDELAAPDDYPAPREDDGYDEEYDEDDPEFDDAPGTALPGHEPALASPSSVTEAPESAPSLDDPYEPSTAEFFENVPSAQAHLADRTSLDDPGATAEYDVEKANADDSEAPPARGEDVLEETPEFLSDTPDHDRLWFEQRPPRDFDFDG